MTLKRLLSVTELSWENLRFGVLWGVLVALLGANILLYPRVFVGEFLKQKSYDLGFLVRDFVLRKEIAVTNVVIAYMDEDSHDQLDQKYNKPWDRRIHAQFLTNVFSRGAEAVVFDIVFSDPSEGDSEFAAALRYGKKVILAADNAPFRQAERANQVEIPTENLLEPLTGATIDSLMNDLSPLKRHIGVDEVESDSDFEVRRHKPFNPTDQAYPLSWVAAEMLGAGTTKDPKGWMKDRWINYYGPPREVIRKFPYYQAILEINDTNRFAPDFFAGKVVFVGADLLTSFSGQRKDSYRSPYPRTFSGTDKHTGNYENFAPVPGVEVQATKFLNLLRGDWLTRLPASQEFWLTISVGFVSTMLLTLLRPESAVLFGVFLGFLLSALGIYSAIFRLVWFTWLVPVVQVGLGTVGSVAYNSFRLALHRSRLQQSVAMYVSPAVASEVLKSPQMMQPGAKMETISIIFTDIANFTNMTEGMDSDTLAHLMNSYFEAAVNRSIHPTQGTVVKFIGDAIFAIWNAPLPQPNHRELACRAALLLRDQVTDFHFNNPDQVVRTRIGLHCGRASVGNFGSSNRVDYTAFGENVNLSSRMEGLNKYLGTSILATGDIVEPVETLFTVRYLGAFQLKGFVRAVKVYELMGEMDRQETTAALRSEFAAGVAAFQKRDFDAAELAFKRVLQMNPKDGPSKFYLSHVNEYRVDPPGESWKGEIELKEK